MEKLLLIDGHSILTRAFYGVPILTNSEGVHTNAVYGFLNIMFKLIDEEEATALAVAFDLRAPSFRHEMYEEYKGTRKGLPDELHEQVPLTEQILADMGIPILTKEGFEADDILGTISRKAENEGAEVTIVTGDRDLLQLADTHVKISIPKTSKGVTTVYNYYPEDVEREYGVTPVQFIDVKALQGDQSDNIPGVPGIGEKTARALIAEYGSVEGVYENIDSVKPARAQKALEGNRELADLSYVLSKIRLDAPVDLALDDARIGNIYTQAAYEDMKKLGLKSILKRFEGSELPETDFESGFRLITDLSAADEIFNKAKNAEGTIGAQLITEKDEVCALTLSLDGREVYVIRKGGLITGEHITENLNGICRCEGHDVWFIDVKGIMPFTDLDYDVTVYDAGVAAYLLNPLADAYEYDDIAKDWLDLTLPSRADLLKKQKFSEAFEKDEKAALTCAGYMGLVAYRAAGSLTEKLREKEMDSLYTDMELPLIYTLGHMETEGIAVKRDGLAAYAAELREQIRRLEREIWDMTGEEFNINSPKQLGEILFEKMGIKGGKKTKTGYSTAADVLEKLAPDYPVVQKILDYRTYTKLNSTYAEGLDAYIAPDGRIHSKFNQKVTATGRISSTEPNLQNIPVKIDLGRQIRKVFVPKDGFIFIDADYSQIELRVLASMSGDERLISAYSNAQDIHAITASQVFGVPIDEVTPLQRRNAKAVNFGIIYGISSFGLSEDLSISRKEATEYIDKYFETYPDVKRFLDGLVEFAKENGYAVTMFKRRRPIPELKSSNFMQRSFGERAAMNSPIQGSAADIIKTAMVRVDKRLRDEGLESRLILQIHDELLIEAKESEEERVKEILSDEMSNAAKLKVKLEIGMHTGKNWYEAK